ncbi:MAG: c-type cytochrome, partial [Rhodanobacteraceae bacterium]
MQPRSIAGIRLERENDCMGIRQGFASVAVLVFAGVAFAQPAHKTHVVGEATVNRMPPKPAAAGSAALPVAPVSASTSAQAAASTTGAAEQLAALEKIPTKPGDASAGQGKAAVCGACHGIDGNSTDAQYPKLAGQNEEY